MFQRCNDPGAGNINLEALGLAGNMRITICLSQGGLHSPNIDLSGMEMYCYDVEVMSSNPSRVELGVHSTSVQVALESQLNLRKNDILRPNFSCNTFCILHLVPSYIFHHVK